MGSWAVCPKNPDVRDASRQPDKLAASLRVSAVCEAELEVRLCQMLLTSLTEVPFSAGQG